MLQNFNLLNNLKVQILISLYFAYLCVSTYKSKYIGGCFCFKADEAFLKALQKDNHLNVMFTESSQLLKNNEI